MDYISWGEGGEIVTSVRLRFNHHKNKNQSFCQTGSFDNLKCVSVLLLNFTARIKCEGVDVSWILRLKLLHHRSNNGDLGPPNQHNILRKIDNPFSVRRHHYHLKK